MMSILTYDTIDEAVRRANDTELGLAAGVFGKDLNACHEVISQLEAGITWVNSWENRLPRCPSAVGSRADLAWRMDGGGWKPGSETRVHWLRCPDPSRQCSRSCSSAEYQAYITAMWHPIDSEREYSFHSCSL